MRTLATIKTQVWNIRRNPDGKTRSVDLMPEIADRPGEFGNGLMIPLTLPIEQPIASDQVVTVTFGVDE
jgi:hypothetical protein